MRIVVLFVRVESKGMKLRRSESGVREARTFEEGPWSYTNVS